MSKVTYKWVLEQRSDEWLAARIGKVGGSEASDTYTKAKRETLLYKKLAELATGEVEKVWVNDAMRRGIENEGKVVALYEEKTGNRVYDCGQILNSDFEYAALSPDGLVSENADDILSPHTGAIEIKCPTSKQHIKNVLEMRRTSKPPKQYMPQLLHYFLIDESIQWVDFITWDDRCSIDYECVRLHLSDVEDELEDHKLNIERFSEELEDGLDELGMI